MWMAPELLNSLNGRKVDTTQAVDTYAMGIMLWEALELREPWTHPNGRPIHGFSHQMFKAVESGQRPLVSEKAAAGASGTL